MYEDDIDALEDDYDEDVWYDEDADEEYDEDVDEVVESIEWAGLARRIAFLRPKIGVKGWFAIMVQCTLTDRDRSQNVLVLKEKRDGREIRK